MSDVATPAAEPQDVPDTGPRELHHTEQHEAPLARLLRRVKITDVLIIVGFITIVVTLSLFLVHRLQLKHDVAAATVVTNQVIADLAKRDGTAARNLGTDKFKSTYTAYQLTQQFQAIRLVTSEKPTVYQQAATSGPAGKTVAISYQYPKKLANKSFYVVVAVTKHSGSNQWLLTNISGSADPSQVSL